MIYKIYTSRYETIKFLYGLGKGHQQYNVSDLPFQFQLWMKETGEDCWSVAAWTTVLPKAALLSCAQYTCDIYAKFFLLLLNNEEVQK